MNVLSNTATLELNRTTSMVLEEQLRQTRDRFNVGDVTRTDVAQAEARLAGARSPGQRRGIDPAHQHRRLPPEYRRRAAPAGPGAGPWTATSRSSLDAAIANGLREHPQVVSAISTRSTGPRPRQDPGGSSSRRRSACRARSASSTTRTGRTRASSSGSSAVRLNIPIYEGGQTYAQIRQAKETVGQYRIQVDQVRDRDQSGRRSSISGAGSRPPRRRSSRPRPRSRPTRWR